MVLKADNKIYTFNDKAMFNFLILTQLAMSPQTTMAVANGESSYESQACSTDVEKRSKAFPIESSIDRENCQKPLLDETIDSQFFDILNRPSTTQATLPSDHAPVLLPSLKTTETVTVPMQPLVSETVIIPRDDNQTNSISDRLNPKDNNCQHNSSLVF